VSRKGMSQVSDVLEQGGDEGATLLLYLAGELPGADRAELERRLAEDATLRQRLERLREAHDRFVEAMPALDRTTRLAVPESVAVRRVAAAMRQWQDADATHLSVNTMGAGLNTIDDHLAALATAAQAAKTISG